MENGRNEDGEPDSGSSATNGTSFEASQVVDQPTSKRSKKSQKVEAEPSKKKFASYSTKPDVKALAESLKKLHISLGKAKKDYESNNFAVTVKELQMAKTIVGSETRTKLDPTVLITYWEAIANLKSRSLEAIRTNYATLKSLTQNENKNKSVYPCIFYALAKYQFVLKCPSSEIEKSLRECSQVFRFELPKLFGHVTLGDLFPEMSCPLELRDLVLKLTQELRTPGDILFLLHYN
jgi:hypothetical protein